MRPPRQPETVSPIRVTDTKPIVVADRLPVLLNHAFLSNPCFNDMRVILWGALQERKPFRKLHPQTVEGLVLQ